MAMMKMPPLGRIGQTMGRMGRMGDTTLVHMNPQEIQGLATLGRLTYNPITGLPEAFNFSEVIEEAVEEKETDRGKQYFVDLVEKIHETLQFSNRILMMVNAVNVATIITIFVLVF